MGCTMLIGIGGSREKNVLDVGDNFVERTHLLFAISFSLYTGIVLLVKNHRNEITMEGAEVQI